MHDSPQPLPANPVPGSTEPATSQPAVPLRNTTLRAILGPTAVGKSALALSVAERAGAEIVSLDSMQVYRGMDIGTAKPTAADLARVRHHMIDLVEPHERYDVQRFVRDLARVLDDLAARGKPALFVGGTGFYLKVLVDGLFEAPDVDVELRARLMQRAKREGNDVLHRELSAVDPQSAARIHPNDTKRVVRGLEVFAQTGAPLSTWQTQWKAGGARPARHLVGLTADTDEVDERIRVRARRMLEQGWPAEAAAIRAGAGFGVTAVQALGYAQALAVFDGRLTPEEAAEIVVRDTRQFARRQRTWYRKFQDIVWFDTSRETGAECRPASDLVGEALRVLRF